MVLLSVCFVVRYFVSCLFCHHLDGEERPGCIMLVKEITFLDSAEISSVPVFIVTSLTIRVSTTLDKK